MTTFFAQLEERAKAINSLLCIGLDPNPKDFTSAEAVRDFCFRLIDLTSEVALAYKPNSGLGHTKITFTNLIAESTVKIYSLTGELVRTLNDDGGLGQINWDAANDDGQKVASGLYIFLVTSADGKHKSGKLAIIK